MAYHIKLSVKGDHEAKLTSFNIHERVKAVSIYTSRKNIGNEKNGVGMAK